MNLNDTFRVEDGLFKVRYDKWKNFTDEFGHIFYREPFNYYRLAAEYRFVGDQVSPIAPGLEWAIRNNGLMIHSPHPKTMMKDQDFPISIEVQLLGGFGKPRTTANLCTPGTNVEMDGKLVTRHCTNSKSKTYEGDQWVRVEVVVHGDELIRHMVEGETVLEYTVRRSAAVRSTPSIPRSKWTARSSRAATSPCRRKRRRSISGKSSCSTSKAAWIRRRRTTGRISSRRIQRRAAAERGPRAALSPVRPRHSPA